MASANGTMSREMKIKHIEYRAAMLESNGYPETANIVRETLAMLREDEARDGLPAGAAAAANNIRVDAEWLGRQGLEITQKSLLDNLAVLAAACERGRSPSALAALMLVRERLAEALADIDEAIEDERAAITL